MLQQTLHHPLWALPNSEKHAHTSTGFLMPQEAITQLKEGYGHQRFTSHHPQSKNVVPTPYFGHVHRVNMQLRASLLAKEEARACATLQPCQP